MTLSRSPQCPSLPPELWIRILTYNSDLTHLWTVCRHVSSHFRAYTEQVFAESVLRTTKIDFHLEKYNLGGKSKRPEVPTSFARLIHAKSKEPGGEKKLVCFKDHRKKSEIASGKQKEYMRIMERWESNVKERKPQLPNYTIRVGNTVNDTELSGLSIDIATRQIEFDWRSTFTLFFREQALLRVLRAKWEAESEKTMEINKKRLANNEHLTVDDYPMPRAAAEVEMRKQIRRKRLKEHYVKNEQMVWAIGSLEHFESHTSAYGNSKAFKLNPDLPGSGVGEKFFGSVNLVQELYLDEWSCMHRIDTKIEHMKGEEDFSN